MVFAIYGLKKSRFSMLKRQDVREVTKKVAFSIVREGFSQRPTAFTPLTVRNFLINELSCVVSSTRTVSSP